MSGGCLVGVLGMACRCPECVLLVSGGCLVVAWRVSFCCLEGVTVPLVHSNIARNGINHHYTVQFSELLLQ